MFLKTNIFLLKYTKYLKYKQKPQNDLFYNFISKLYIKLKF